jgi:hypothetical protein
VVRDTDCTGSCKSKYQYIYIYNVDLLTVNIEFMW